MEKRTKKLINCFWFFFPERPEDRAETQRHHHGAGGGGKSGARLTRPQPMPKVPQNLHIPLDSEGASGILPRGHCPGQSAGDRGVRIPESPYGGEDVAPQTGPPGAGDHQTPHSPHDRSVQRRNQPQETTSGENYFQNKKIDFIAMMKTHFRLID